ncbi:hypothetical protein RRG08_021183 [Elysia crispata]|uniref:Protein kinase domain-containing protein n=1 Tax=Elysia crispata TaxID=231223 RepID=A0AAE0YP75_9GAST|nr:hypothetical protein RRG08_021183 [Elysia crispata]
MGKKIQCIGRYTLEGHLLGKGSFARVELAHHSVTGCKSFKILNKSMLGGDKEKQKKERRGKEKARV